MDKHPRNSEARLRYDCLRFAADNFLRENVLHYCTTHKAAHAAEGKDKRDVQAHALEYMKILRERLDEHIKQAESGDISWLL